MRYRNTKTGQIIDVPSVIRGGNWERIDGVKKPEKDSSAVVIPEPDESEVQEVVNSTAKPKRTRKSKK